MIHQRTSAQLSQSTLDQVTNASSCSRHHSGPPCTGPRCKFKPPSDGSSSEEEVKRSRAHPLQWTRVKSLDMIRVERVMVYKAAEDL